MAFNAPCLPFAAPAEASSSNDLLKLFGKSRLDAGSPAAALAAAPSIGNGEHRKVTAHSEPPGRPPALLAPSFFKQPPPGMRSVYNKGSRQIWDEVESHEFYACYGNILSTRFRRVDRTRVALQIASQWMVAQAAEFRETSRAGTLCERRVFERRRFLGQPEAEPASLTVAPRRGALFAAAADR